MKKKAYNVDKVKSLLNENVMNVTFTKKDGTERVMKCTRNWQLVEAFSTNFAPPLNINSVPDEVVVVWDMEKDDWRRFDINSLIKIDHVI